MGFYPNDTPNDRMPGISIHIVDVTSGRPARGMRVEVHRQNEGRRERIASGAIDADGLLQHPIVRGGGRGPRRIHRVDARRRVFPVAAGRRRRPAFQEIALYRFVIGDATQHYHLPVKLSSWGLSIWRGR